MIQFITINNNSYWEYDGDNYTLFCFSLPELQRQLREIYGIILFNDINLN